MMTSWRSLRHLITTYLEARRGLPTPRAAADSIMFYAMFVAAVAGMCFGLMWLPADADPTRTWFQAIGAAIGAALIVWGLLAMLYRCFGFRLMIILADAMCGAMVGVLTSGFWQGMHRQHPDDWSNWLPLVGAIVAAHVGYLFGRDVVTETETIDDNHWDKRES